MDKHMRLLQRAEAGGGGGEDSEGEKPRHWRKGLDQAHIICDAVRAFPVGADVDPDDAAFVRARGKAGQHGGSALAVEAQPIDYALVAVEPKDARARVARLRQSRAPSHPPAANP